MVVDLKKLTFLDYLLFCLLRTPPYFVSSQVVVVVGWGSDLVFYVNLRDDKLKNSIFESDEQKLQFYLTIGKK